MKMNIENWLLIPDNPPPNPDCFVIPSYAVKNRNTPTKPTRALIELACTWMKRSPHAKLIVSTGDNQNLGITNAKIMADYAVGLGIPRRNIIEEDRSKDTYENLIYSQEIIKKLDFKQPALILLDLYAKRAVATARKLGWKNLYWLSVYSEGEPAYGYKWLQTHSRATIFCYEIISLIYSKIVGWI